MTAPNNHFEMTQSLLNRSLSEITDYLNQYSAELKKTRFPDIYLIKFTQETKLNHPELKHLRGLIFNHKTKEILSLTYPVPIEVKDLEISEQDQLCQALETKPYIVQEVPDATLMRYSYLPPPAGTAEEGEWMLSTNGKLDAREAYWMNGQSFYEQFWSCQPQIDFDQLNRNYVYLFLLCHPLNVIVVNHQEAKLYYVISYDRRTMREVGACLAGFPTLPNLPLTISEVRQKVKESREKPVAFAGYMVISPDPETGFVMRYRFENYNYTEARDLRGDSNNINYHLLELMLNSTEPEKLVEFLDYFPIYRKTRDSLMARIGSLTDLFYQNYGIHFKRHEYVQMHPRHYPFLKQLHGELYLNHLKLQGRTVQRSDIFNYLMNQPPAKLLYLLNYMGELRSPMTPSSK